MIPKDPMFDAPLDEMARSLQEATAGVVTASKLATSMEQLIESALVDETDPHNYPMLVQYSDANKTVRVVRTLAEIGSTPYRILETKYGAR